MSVCVYHLILEILIYTNHKSFGSQFRSNIQQTLLSDCELIQITAVKFHFQNIEICEREREREILLFLIYVNETFFMASVCACHGLIFCHLVSCFGSNSYVLSTCIPTHIMLPSYALLFFQRGSSSRIVSPVSLFLVCLSSSAFCPRQFIVFSRVMLSFPFSQCCFGVLSPAFVFLVFFNAPCWKTSWIDSPCDPHLPWHTVSLIFISVTALNLWTIPLEIYLLLPPLLWLLFCECRRLM